MRGLVATFTSRINKAVARVEGVISRRCKRLMQYVRELRSSKIREPDHGSYVEYRS